MIDNFEFSEGDKKTAKMYFDAADTLLADAIADKKRTLHEKIIDGEIVASCISDATIIEKTSIDGKVIEKKRPIIDLVQQGGGMWGIALLGYCYIMEKIGIRFYSHGGTSAGAINALFLASISADIYKEPAIIETTDKRGALKSEILTLIVSNMDFSSFMNREGLIGVIQERLFKNLKSKFLPIIIGIASIIILVLMYHITAFLVIKNGSNMNVADTTYFSVVIAVFSIMAFTFLMYILFTKALGENFGMNTGDPFLIWVKDNMAKLNINTTDDLHQSLSETQLVRSNALNTKKEQAITMIFSQEDVSRKQRVSDTSVSKKPILKSKVMNDYLDLPNDEPLDVEHPKLVIIATNLSHNRIVRFPRRASEYWENYKFVHPAAYVRASMSLPFIFQTFIPNGTDHFGVKKNENKVKLKARFVDGGMLSNFPIREFHRPSNRPPSFPTFGVLLSERAEIKTETNLGGQENSLMKYVMSYIKTFRNFYDNDFMIGNEEIKNRVVTINTTQINWLDFWMKDETKKKLFMRGAEAAIEQIDKFDWSTYKEIRIKMIEDGQ